MSTRALGPALLALLVAAQRVVADPLPAVVDLLAGPLPGLAAAIQGAQTRGSAIAEQGGWHRSGPSALGTGITHGGSLPEGAGGGQEGSVLLPFWSQAGDDYVNTTGPSVAVDRQGGIHVAYVANTADRSGNKPALYAYCSNGCADLANWQKTTLGQAVSYVALALDPRTDQPRLLIVQLDTRDYHHDYVYAVCDGACVSGANWVLTPLVAAQRVGELFRAGRFFALDSRGRPRFVYGDDQSFNPNHYGTFLAYCDADDCTTPANWWETRLTLDGWFSPSLALTRQGEVRLAFKYSRVENYTVISGVAYLACDASCSTGSVRAVFNQTGQNTWFTLQLDALDRPRLALYTGNVQNAFLDPATLYYLWCDASCADPSANTWQFAKVGLPPVHGYYVDLVLDAQGRPRMAYNTLSSGMGYSSCLSQCESPHAVWQHRNFDLAEALNQTWYVPQGRPRCALSTWAAGDYPSLALDATGSPRIGFNVLHGEGGINCYAIDDIRLVGFTLFPCAAGSGECTLGPRPGDANCDGRVTAPDLPRLAQLIAAGDPGPCGLADANGDQSVNAGDLQPTIQAIFQQ